MLKKIIQEPLLHFAILGGLLFWLFAYLNPSVEEQNDNQIKVTEYKIQQLFNFFQKKWQRPPTAVELKRLIDDYVVEEAYYREALAMQMDKNDTVIRRRLRQKMEFLLADASAAAKPTDAQLQTYLDAHPAAFIVPARYSLRQIYINPNQPEGTERVAAIQQQLDEGLYVIGDSTMLPKRLQDTPTNQIDRVFGQGFTQSFAQMPLQRWQGPIRSGFGLHWVYLEQQTPARHPKLTEVRSEVLREYAYDKRQKLQQEVTTKLLEKYHIVVDWPEPAEQSSDEAKAPS